MKRTITATILGLTIFVAGCGQEPSTDTSDATTTTATAAATTEPTWSEYAGCIDGIAAEKAKELLKNSALITGQQYKRISQSPIMSNHLDSQPRAWDCAAQASSVRRGRRSVVVCQRMQS